MARAVKNYGHYWNRDFIDWGGRGRGNAGTLIGYSKEKKTKKCDFRNQIGVYILYDNDLKVVYIGQAGSGDDNRLFVRLKEHTCNHLRGRWKYFSWFGFRKVLGDGSLSDAQHPDSSVSARTKDFLDEIEAVLLQIMEPKLNKQGPRWGDAEEYLQDVDSKILENVDIMSKLQSIEAAIGNMAKGKNKNA